MFTFAKGFVYKFCFCLGLGTATLYSYGEVKKWVHAGHVQTADQVDPVVEKHVKRETTIYDDTYIPQVINYSPATNAAVVATGAESTEVVPPVVAPEEKKEETAEKKDETAEKKEDEINGVAGTILPNQNLPMAYIPQNGQVTATASAPEEDKPYSPEIPLLPASLPSPTPTSQSGYSGSASNNTSNSYTPLVGALDATDIEALISPMKASFEDEMNQSNGLLCEVGGRHSCERRNHVSIHSLRWGMDEGLKKEVKFTIKSTGATSLEFNFDFKIQNNTLAEESVSITARPVDVLVHQETKDSKIYRVIEFKFSDLSVRGEMIKHVQAVMMYEVTSNGLVLTKDSGLSFTRSKIEVLVSKWELLAVGESEVDREPAAQSGVFLIADELSFSMNVEKSL